MDAETMSIIDKQIEQIIDQAIAEKRVHFNKHGAGGFYLAVEQVL